MCFQHYEKKIKKKLYRLAVNRVAYAKYFFPFSNKIVCFSLKSILRLPTGEYFHWKSQFFSCLLLKCNDELRYMTGAKGFQFESIRKWYSLLHNSFPFHSRFFFASFTPRGRRKRNAYLLNLLSTCLKYICGFSFIFIWFQFDIYYIHMSSHWIDTGI